MLIDLTKLNNGIIKEIVINEKIEFTKENLKNTDLLALSNVSVIGKITSGSVDYNLNLKISGIMQLSCAITLEPVDYPFSLEINDDLTNLIGENEVNIKKSENSIDIFPIIWENILVEIPMRVVSEKAKDLKLEGNGWRMLSEDDIEQETNPELEKLKDLL